MTSRFVSEDPGELAKLERDELSWGAFTVLCILWIWGEQETRHLVFASSGLSEEDRRRLAELLRVVIRTVGGPGAADGPASLTGSADGR